MNEADYVAVGIALFSVLVAIVTWWVIRGNDGNGG